MENRIGVKRAEGECKEDEDAEKLGLEQSRSLVNGPVGSVIKVWEITRFCAQNVVNGFTKDAVTLLINSYQMWTFNVLGVWV